MRNAGGNVDDVARAKRVALAAVEPRADRFARPRRPAAGHRAAEDERPLAALDIDDVDDRVVLFGIAVGIGVVLLGLPVYFVWRGKPS